MPFLSILRAMMSESRIPLKNPVVAAVLAYLVPGAGHIYQGRLFKGALYSVCILGTFLYGMYLADWKAVYYRWEPGKRTLGYLSQVMVGLPALPAIIQSKRYESDDNIDRNSLDAPLSAEFQGELLEQSADGDITVGELSGRIELKPVAGQFGDDVRGTFQGTLNGEQEITLSLSGLAIARKVAASQRREVASYVVEEGEAEELVATSRQIMGTIPRSFANWFEVPLEGEHLERIGREKGKYFELACVYTWIAGLLNILAVWDALEGPAYGYGDEEPEESDKKPDSDKTAKASETPTEPEPDPKPALAEAQVIAEDAE